MAASIQVPSPSTRKKKTTSCFPKPTLQLKLYPVGRWANHDSLQGRLFSFCCYMETYKFFEWFSCLSRCTKFPVPVSLECCWNFLQLCSPILVSSGFGLHSKPNWFQFVPSPDQIADIFKKGLSTQQFHLLRSNCLSGIIEFAGEC